MGKTMSTRIASKAEARSLLAKADEFVEAARSDLDAGRFSASALAAVHAGISGADAVTAAAGSVVSASPDHFQVIRLLQTLLPGALPAKDQRQLVGLLNAKNEVEYSGHATHA
jgi:hypothetical protein